MPLADPSTPPSSLSPISGIAFAVVIFGGALGSVPVAMQLDSPADATVLNGQWASAFTAAFDDVLPGRDLAVGVWGAIETTLLSSGRPGVLVGSDGWLFTAEEFESDGPLETRIADAVELAQRAQARLSTSGGTLVVAVIPDKSRLYGDHLGRHRRPAVLGDRLPRLRAALNAAGISAPDLVPALSPLNVRTENGRTENGRTDGFLRTDTHWSPEGAAQVAQALATATPAIQGTTRFDRHTESSVDHVGDLVGFLALGPFESLLAPAPDLLRVERVVQSTGGSVSAADLFGDVELPIALVGTSFSADERWGFAGSIKRAYSMDVVNLADPGEGPVVPMQRWLSAAAADPEVTLPRLLIWEYPERYLHASPKAPASPEGPADDVSP